MKMFFFFGNVSSKTVLSNQNRCFSFIFYVLCSPDRDQCGAAAPPLMSRTKLLISSLLFIFYNVLLILFFLKYRLWTRGMKINACLCLSSSPGWWFSPEKEEQVKSSSWSSALSPCDLQRSASDWQNVNRTQTSKCSGGDDPEGGGPSSPLQPKRTSLIVKKCLLKLKEDISWTVLPPKQRAELSWWGFWGHSEIVLIPNVTLVCAAAGNDAGRWKRRRLTVETWEEERKPDVCRLYQSFAEKHSCCLIFHFSIYK